MPNKGSLSDATVEMLREAGYRTRRDTKELVVADPDNDVEFFYLRPRDIAVYVGSGTVDAGVTGRDLLLDSGLDRGRGHVPRLRRVDLPVCRAARQGGHGRRHRRQAGRDELPGSRRADLDARGHAARSCASTAPWRRPSPSASPTSSPTSSRPARRCASQGLEVFGEPILRSEAVLIRGDRPGEEQAVSVLAATHRRRHHRTHLRHARLRLSPGARRRGDRLTPGLESPTVSPMQDEAWVAVRAMVPRVGRNRLMDELYDLGARAILVTDIAACRL